MTITEIKAGGWAPGEILTSTQMNTLNTELPKAIDGSAGGTYAPSGLITIGGSGVSLHNTNICLAGHVIGHNDTLDDDFPYSVVLNTDATMATDITYTLGEDGYTSDGRCFWIVNYNTTYKVTILPGDGTTFVHPLGITSFELLNYTGSHYGAMVHYNKAFLMWTVVTAMYKH